MNKTGIREMKKTLMMLVLAAGCHVQAAPFFYENFQATSGNANGTAWSTACASGVWAGGYTVAEQPVSSSGDLSYTGLEASAGNGKLNLHNPISANRGLVRNKTNWTSVNSGGYYCSFLLRVTDFSSFGTTWDAGDHFFSLYGSSGSNVIGVRSDGAGGGKLMIAKQKADLANGPTDPKSSDEISLSANTTYLVVVGTADVTDSSAGSFKLWVNPTALGGTAPAATTAGKWRWATDKNTRVWFGNGETTGASLTGVNVDELRIGTTYADVTPSGYVPEQGTIIMVK